MQISITGYDFRTPRLNSYSTHIESRFTAEKLQAGLLQVVDLGFIQVGFRILTWWNVAVVACKISGQSDY